ncbi:hypothetical protein BSQ44_06760 [Aquibium oceanicum]|uniref:Uncharacterized protein n=2 Tax=Aquibium oceanicum TaxID=1670800 RepID=A0A1L3SP72_9HYPH|nr:hypothetical protein BSQ44_06760 [Aquibium oceanicum]
MDVQAAMMDERMLRRVIALLVSFAALAERAAGRSAPVRWFVLMILRHAEAVAENYVCEMTGMRLLKLEGVAPVGNDPDDALSLVARFYALAAALCALLPLVSLFDRQCEGRRRASVHAVPGSGRSPSGWMLEPQDTS